MVSTSPFDLAALEAYLREHLRHFAGPLTLQQFPGGQSNPTYHLQSAHSSYVLRKKPAGPLLPSAHAVEREYRVMHALRHTKVPVPPLYLLCEDESVIGQAFYLMGLVEGRVIRDPACPQSDAAERTQIYHAMAQTLAELHKLDVVALGLSDYGRPGNYYERQYRRWCKQYEAAGGEDIPAMRALIAWLAKNLPSSETLAIAHGDYRLENLVIKHLRLCGGRHLGDATRRGGRHHGDGGRVPPARTTRACITQRMTEPYAPCWTGNSLPSVIHWQTWAWCSCHTTSPLAPRQDSRQHRRLRHP